MPLFPSERIVADFLCHIDNGALLDIALDASMFRQSLFYRLINIGANDYEKNDPTDYAKFYLRVRSKLANVKAGILHNWAEVAKTDWKAGKEYLAVVDKRFESKANISVEGLPSSRQTIDLTASSPEKLAEAYERLIAGEVFDVEREDKQ